MAKAVVNEAMARRFFGQADPVGRQFRWGTNAYEIVGAGMSTTSAFLMGRKLYGEWSEYWPANPVFSFMRSKSRGAYFSVVEKNLPAPPTTTSTARPA